jgi:hypothetical protein
MPMALFHELHVQRDLLLMIPQLICALCVNAVGDDRRLCKENDDASER